MLSTKQNIILNSILAKKNIPHNYINLIRKRVINNILQRNKLHKDTKKKIEYITNLNPKKSIFTNHSNYGINKINEANMIKKLEKINNEINAKNKENISINNNNNHFGIDIKNKNVKQNDNMFEVSLERKQENKFLGKKMQRPNKENIKKKRRSDESSDTNSVYCIDNENRIVKLERILSGVYIEKNNDNDNFPKNNIQKSKKYCLIGDIDNGDDSNDKNDQSYSISSNVSISSNISNLNNNNKNNIINIIEDNKTYKKNRKYNKLALNSFETKNKIYNYNKSNKITILKRKEVYVNQLLQRWWYALPPWPPENYNTSYKLRKNKLKVVDLTKWNIKPNINSKNYKKCIELPGYKYVYLTYDGKVYDFRPKKNKPTFNNLMKLNDIELHENLVKALKNQLNDLEKRNYYSEADLRENIKNQLEIAETNLKHLKK